MKLVGATYMVDWQGRTPVAFIIFNRPDTTARVFEAIRQVRPPKLLVVADGPRAQTPDDAARCQAARAIIEQVDWPCEVLKNYADKNLGCRARVSSGLDWVFSNVNEAIILEDDCLPHPTFFRFCEELLKRYRDDDRIMMITGTNKLFGQKRTSYSYYFSRYVHVWGWASWKRAWKHYDASMKAWPEIRDGGWLRDIFREKRVERYWHRMFERVYNGGVNTWDYQWTFACLTQNGVTILPSVNLISNIGFGSMATHTQGRSAYADMKMESMSFPLKHPVCLIRDEQSDAITDKTEYIPLLKTRIWNKIKKILG